MFHAACKCDQSANIRPIGIARSRPFNFIVAANQHGPYVVLACSMMQCVQNAQCRYQARQTRISRFAPRRHLAGSAKAYEMMQGRDFRTQRRYTGKPMFDHHRTAAHRSGDNVEPQRHPAIANRDIFILGIACDQHARTQTGEIETFRCRCKTCAGNDRKNRRIKLGRPDQLSIGCRDGRILRESAGPSE